MPRNSVVRHVCPVAIRECGSAATLCTERRHGRRKNAASKRYHQRFVGLFLSVNPHFFGTVWSHGLGVMGFMAASLHTCR